MLFALTHSFHKEYCWDIQLYRRQNVWNRHGSRFYRFSQSFSFKFKVVRRYNNTRGTSKWFPDKTETIFMYDTMRYLTNVSRAVLRSPQQDSVLFQLRSAWRLKSAALWRSRNLAKAIADPEIHKVMSFVLTVWAIRARIMQSSCPLLQ